MLMRQWQLMRSLYRGIFYSSKEADIFVPFQFWEKKLFGPYFFRKRHRRISDIFRWTVAYPIPTRNHGSTANKRTNYLKFSFDRIRSIGNGFSLFHAPDTCPAHVHACIITFLKSEHNKSRTNLICIQIYISSSSAHRYGHAISNESCRPVEIVALDRPTLPCDASVHCATHLSIQIDLMQHCLAGGRPDA